MYLKVDSWLNIIISKLMFKNCKHFLVKIKEFIDYLKNIIFSMEINQINILISILIFFFTNFFNLTWKKKFDKKNFFHKKKLNKKINCHLSFFGKIVFNNTKTQISKNRKYKSMVWKQQEFDIHNSIQTLKLKKKLKLNNNQQSNYHEIWNN